MLAIREINKKDFELCFTLDTNTIAFWNLKQWKDELNKEGVKTYELLFKNLTIGICSFQVVIDEAQINYFSVNEEFRRQRFGSYLMKYLIDECMMLNIKKILLEVSEKNLIAQRFYSKFNFFTVGIRKSYYKDGSDALLKEKILIKNNL